MVALVVFHSVHTNIMTSNLQSKTLIANWVEEVKNLCMSGIVQVCYVSLKCISFMSEISVSVQGWMRVTGVRMAPSAPVCIAAVTVGSWQRELR